MEETYERTIFLIYCRQLSAILFLFTSLPVFSDLPEIVADHVNDLSEALRNEVVSVVVIGVLPVENLTDNPTIEESLDGLTALIYESFVEEGQIRLIEQQRMDQISEAILDQQGDPIRGGCHSTSWSTDWCRLYRR